MTGGGRSPFAAPGRPAEEARRRSEEAGRFGVAVLIVSLTVLFAASMVGFLVVRAQTVAWRAEGLPPLPRGLWASTAAILAASLAVHGALRAARRDAQRALRFRMAATTALGGAFLLLQLWNWESLMASGMLPTTRSLYAFVFFVMTGLHAAHVVGGLVPLAIVTDRAFQGRYGPARHAGVLYCAMYWHFLDGVWLALLAMLFTVA